MKKILALILALLCLPAAAFADVLADGWQDATLEELLAAQEAIADQVSALRAASYEQAEALTYSGTGTKIISGVDVVQIPARVTVEGAVTMTLTGGSYDHKFNPWEREMACDVLTEAATYDMMVEGSGDWTITIEPLKAGGTMSLSGVGPYVSDFFELPGATIVNCSMDASMTDAWTASLYIYMGEQYEHFDSWRQESVIGDALFSKPLTLTGEAIIKPVKGRDLYFWIISVPVGAEWSIEAQ